MNLEALLATGVGKGQAEKVFKNARLVNVFTGEILETGLAVTGGRVVGVGDYRGAEELDLQGRYVCPGFIDGHVHLESSMVTPAEFARGIVPQGTTTVIADPHEIANVCGVAGIEYMLAATAALPLTVYLMLPSCVPATSLETAGARLTATDLAPFCSHPRVLGLGEVMDINAVLAGQADMMAKLELCRDMVLDGHSPGLSGKELNTYILAGVRSDHECVHPAEAWERLRLGMHLMLRESSASKNLQSLLPVVTPFTARRCLLVTDDRHPAELLHEGHINHLVRLAVQAGLDPVTVIQMATINTAQYFGLKDLGALAPGYAADFLVLDNLEDFRPLRVYRRGLLVAENGRLLVEPAVHRETAVEHTLRLSPLQSDQLRLPALGSRARVIGLVPQQITTRKMEMKAPNHQGCFVADPLADVLKLAVIERHHGTGNVGKGLVSGFGLSGGAIASSVAHDSHNVVVIGANDTDMITAVAEVARLGGGLALARDGKVLGSLALPIAGLMSLKPLEEVEAELSCLRRLAFQMGVRPWYDPFMTLAFLALPVIPELKLTDLGLVDVREGSIVPVAIA